MEQFEIFPVKKFVDERGIFARTFDQEVINLNKFKVLQCNISVNPKIHTLRGLHYQVSGPIEKKYISLINGSVFLALVDLRRTSPTLGHKYEILLKVPLAEAIYVPNGFATGWISLEPNTTLQYLMSARYEDCTYAGVNYQDQTLSINWPENPRVISSQDQIWPSFLEYLEN